MDTDPDTQAAVMLDAVLRQLRTAVIARVEAYNPTLQTADVTPQVREFVMTAGVPEYLPAQRVDGCPVMWPGGSTGGLTAGLAVGDLVLALIRDRSHDEVDSGAALPSTPLASRRFDLSDVLVLPAYHVPGTLPATAWRADGAPVLWADAALPVRIGTSTAALALALASLVTARLDVIQTAFNAHVHTGVTTGPGSSGTPATPITGSNDVASARALVDS